MSLYLDHHATTPLDPQVFEAMVPFFHEEFGNPASSSHRRGLRAAAALELAREEIGQSLGADPRGLVLTSGATEANNLAIKGVLAGAGERRHLIVAATEHRSVLDPARRLARNGFDVTILPVDHRGHINLNQLAEAITPKTALVSLMAANNETGLLHPLDEIASICHQKGTLWHCDASQAIGKIPFHVDALGVDLLSFTAHKIYGPGGIGALWVRRDYERIPIVPLVDGGGQEQGLRSGTVPLPLVIGFAEAVVMAKKLRALEEAFVGTRRNELWEQLSQAIPDLVRHGDPDQSLPHTLNVGIPGVDGDALLVKLQLSELCVSSGAACSSMNREPSHVLTAMGVPGPLARASLRFGLGRDNTPEGIVRAVEILSGIVSDLRRKP